MVCMTKQRTDVFPHTQMTWLASRLDEGDAGLCKAREHVMEVYREPLLIYVKGSSFRSIGDPEELVSGFFADRLGRDDYLAEWLSSGRPLRRWLLVGMKYYLKEQIRANKRGGLALGFDPDDEGIDPPSKRYNEASGRRLVARAIAQAEADLRERGFGEHWEVFVAHHLRDRPFSVIARELGVEEKRAAVMSRTAARRFRAVLREIVAWPGASDEELDAEIRELCG
jgi:DNA-directed RNA polymerase specialized sigma24 family protein